MKLSKEDKKLQKKVRKMKIGDEIKHKGYDIVCIEKEFYILVHPNEGIREKHFNELKDWLVSDKDFYE